MEMNNNKKRKMTVLALLLAVGIITVTAAVTYAFLSYRKEGATTNTITSGSIQFHYEETNGIGNGITINDALPVDSNTTAKSAETPFNFRITASTSTGISVPYTITARRSSDSDAIMGDIADLYLTEATSPETATTLFTDPVAFNDLQPYNSNPAERVIYEGVATGNNYEKSFKLRMWVDENAKYHEQCIVDGSVDTDITSEADCTGGTWAYPYNNKRFTITVNVYAQGSTGSAQTYPASTVSYSPASVYPSTRCKANDQGETLECALNELNTLLN